MNSITNSHEMYVIGYHGPKKWFTQNFNYNTLYSFVIRLKQQGVVYTCIITDKLAKPVLTYRKFNIHNYIHTVQGSQISICIELLWSQHIYHLLTSMFFFSLILPRLVAWQYMLSRGTRANMPWVRQLSPTASAFLPCV